MKKITLLLCLVFVLGAYAQNPRVLSHSTDPVPTAGGVSCASAGIGTTENNYWRAYTASEFGESGTVLLTGGQAGISFTDTAAINPSVSIVFTAFTSDDVFPAGTLTEIATGTSIVTVADDITVVSFDFDTAVEIDATQEIIIRMFTPDGTDPDGTLDDQWDVRVGINANGESAPGYISTDVSCGPLPITTFDDLGFPGTHIILDLIVDDILSVEDNVLADNVSIFPNPTNGDMNIAFSRSLGEASVQFTSITGQVVMETTVNGIGTSTLNTSRLSSGIYFAQIATEDASTVIKFVKN